MRGQQLSEIARLAMPERDVRYVELGTRLRNSDVFLTKSALATMTMPILDDLRARGNRLYCDVVDESPLPWVRTHGDVIVASSYLGLSELGREYPHMPVGLVNHHADPRIRFNGALRSIPPLTTGYFGETENALIPAEVADRVDVIHIDTSGGDDAWLGRLGDYNMHYAVRAAQRWDLHKPFLKGFTAAHAGAAIVIQRNQIEAVTWLGDDYPFLIDEPADARAIIAALDLAADSFGSSAWEMAFDVMGAVRERTSPQKIGRELAALFEL